MEREGEPYLIELSQDREKEAMKRAFSMPMVLGPLLSDLGLSSQNWWAILEIPISSIYGNGVGEIDAVLGPLVLGPGGIPEWRPKEGLLAAIEAKASYVKYSSEGNVVFTSSRGWHQSHKNAILHQLPRIVKLGFDRTILLDIICTPPSSGENGQAWLQAGLSAWNASDVIRSKIERGAKRQPFEHWLLGWGSVVGGSENWRGAPILNRIQHCEQNIQMNKPEISSIRMVIANRISDLLHPLSPPLELPLVTRYCKNCRSLHQLHFGGREALCPQA